MSLHLFNVDLLGPVFTIQTDESLDYMQSLVLRLRERWPRSRVPPASPIP